MSSVVVISLLMIIAVLGGVSGLPEQQLEKENQSENKDIRDIILDDFVEMRGRKCGRTNLACRLSGGKCQSNTVRCEGEFLTGRQYCRKSNKCGCCVPPPTRTPKGCVFGDTAYPHGNIIEDTCMQLVCVDGDWKYIGQTHRHCGECIVHGEPHIALYSSTNPTSDVHTYNGTGTFAISQPGFKEHPLFGVKSNFEECHNGYSCVSSATYYEPGLEVQIILPALGPEDYCNNLNATDSVSIIFCGIQVFVNGEERNIDYRNHTVSSFYGTDGNVLVFSHNHINSDKDLNCINVIGSKGFSVSLCQYANDYAWLYVWAMPSLKDQIYGVCDTFPGDDEKFTMRDGSITYTYKESADSWKIGKKSVRAYRKPGADRCSDPTVESQIEGQCHNTTRLCPPHTATFYNSCVYDLCRVSNPDRYLEGYASHVLVHRQISVSSTCSCTYNDRIGVEHGCVIYEASPHDTACKCELRSWSVNFPLYYCRGTVVACKDETSPYCINPDTSLNSCEQGQGNCNGYLVVRH